MPSIGTNSKPAYVYDAGTDTWIPIGPGEHTHDYIGKDVITTTGDIIYASAANTPARRGIGSTGQVLTVSGGLPTWATPATVSSGLTLINATTFSAVASQSINNVFSSTYENYKIILKVGSSSTNVQCQFRYRASGSDITSGYRSAYFQIGSSNGTQTLGSATTFINLGLNRDTISPSGLDITVYTPAVASIRRPLSFVAWNALGDPGTDGGAFGAGDNLLGGAAYDGFSLIASTGTISGTVRTYGLANS